MDLLGGWQAAWQTGGLWGDKDYAVDCGLMIPLGNRMAVHLYLNSDVDAIASVPQ